MKHKTRLFAVLMLFFMLIMQLMGCSSSSGNITGSIGDTAEKFSDDTNENMTTDDRPLIGIMFYSNTDSLGSQNYALINACAKSLGADVTWQVGNFDRDSQLASLQNLISAGCDGIVFQPIGSPDFLSKVIDVCDEAGIYLGIQFSYVSNPEVYEHLTASPYFVGMTYQDERKNAETLVELLVEKECLNVGVGYATPGSDISDKRNTGFDETMKKYGLSKLAEYTSSSDNNVNNVSSSVQNFLSSYPAMDGLLIGSGSGGVGETITKILAGVSRSVPFVCFDTFEGMRDALDRGYCVGAAGGTSPNGLYMFSAVYNAVMGCPLSENHVELVQPALFITTAGEAEIFETYFSDVEALTSVVYTPEYLCKLSKVKNPELSEDAVQDMMNAYSFDWISGQVSKSK